MIKLMIVCRGFAYTRAVVTDTNKTPDLCYVLSRLLVAKLFGNGWECYVAIAIQYAEGHTPIA